MIELLTESLNVIFCDVPGIFLSDQFWRTFPKTVYDTFNTVTKIKVSMETSNIHFSFTFLLKM